MRQLSVFIVFCLLATCLSCRRAQTEFVTVALPESFSTFDTLTSEKSDAAAERVKNLMFNALVRKNASFDYEGDLAESFATSDDGSAITFRLRSGVKFHNGKELTSADVKYTFEQLFNSKAYKKFAFYDAVGKDFASHITAIETPDNGTVVFKLARPALKNQLIPNLVAVPIVAEGTAGQLATQPVGTGPFKFVSLDQSQNTVELEAFKDYWDGAPKITKLRLKTVPDASALQAELQTGGVDIAPNPSNLPPDVLKTLTDLPNLKVEQFNGSNIQYIGFNTQSPPLDNVKVRQAIGYAIDREKIIRELLSGQARLADSILPPESWAYSAGTKYTFDLAKAKQLLQESGYKGEPIKFKYASGNAAFSSYSQAIQNMLVEAGLNIQIETLDPQTIRDDLAKGQFQMNTAVWIGGNQDPIFFRDLFTTAKIPGPTVSCCNRWRYSNQQADTMLEEAFTTTDRSRAKGLYVDSWQLISNDLPLLPLWYPANMVVANKRIGNVQISPSGDWSFIKDITVQ